MSERIGSAVRTACLIREICHRQGERGQRMNACTVMQEIYGKIFAIIIISEHAALIRALRYDRWTGLVFLLREMQTYASHVWRRNRRSIWHLNSKCRFWFRSGTMTWRWSNSNVFYCSQAKFYA